MPDPIQPFPAAFFETDPITCARQLLGAQLIWNRCRGRIVETEAYDVADDPACHTFFRAKARQFVEDHPAGTAYIYLNYGVHWMANVLIKGRRTGFVLIRALEPTHGLAIMKRRRQQQRPESLCSGPGKLTQALGMTGQFHGKCFRSNPRRCLAEGSPPAIITTGVRIGISHGCDLPWRFLDLSSPHISVKPSEKQC